MAPTEISPAGSRTWLVRGQNLVVAFSRLRAGDTLARTGQPHEYLLLLADPATDVWIQAGGEEAAVAGAAIVVVPPGDSVLAARADTTVVRAFDARTTDLADRCHNAASYAEPHPGWPRWSRGRTRSTGTACGCTRSPTTRAAKARSAGSSGPAR
ncbi:hypothetical protein ACFQ1L_24745 [Phytohabitans flavus]|uniref:hypothetical protein n=1 Tax=Phytohabitans flavus TaxID=1076124 RepID=UPI00362FF404